MLGLSYQIGSEVLSFGGGRTRLRDPARNAFRSSDRQQSSCQISMPVNFGILDDCRDGSNFKRLYHLLIAGQALTGGLTLVTNNIRFEHGAVDRRQ